MWKWIDPLLFVSRNSFPSALGQVFIAPPVFRRCHTSLALASAAERIDSAEAAGSHHLFRPLASLQHGRAASTRMASTQAAGAWPISVLNNRANAGGSNWHARPTPQVPHPRPGFRCSAPWHCSTSTPRSHKFSWDSCHSSRLFSGACAAGNGRAVDSGASPSGAAPA